MLRINFSGAASYVRTRKQLEDITDQETDSGDAETQQGHFEKRRLKLSHRTTA